MHVILAMYRQLHVSVHAFMRFLHTVNVLPHESRAMNECV